ncbi:hypothetical protein K443DRAFT_112271, partial [Laccaria amethystina LaAM-08-1]
RSYTYCTMTAALSDDLKMHIASWYVKEGLTYQEIHDRSDCSIGFIFKIMGKYHIHGQVTNPFSKRTGRPSNIDNGDVEYM